MDKNLKRKEIWLEPSVLKKVEVKAKNSRRTTKAYIEYLVIKDVNSDDNKDTKGALGNS